MPRHQKPRDPRVTGASTHKKKRKPSRPTTRSAVRATAESQPFTNLVRLQKVLAAAGVASRRECEKLIEEGRVAIGERIVTQLGTRVDPTTQKVFVDGEPLPQPKLVYFAVHKPQGVVSTSRDEWGRARVTDMVPPGAGRVFTVGRLDMHSEGLILLTNDGALANRLTHPRYGIEKTYHVQVAGKPDNSVLEALKRGVHLAEGVAQVERVRIKSHHKRSSLLEMVLSEGRNREIRRMLATLGHKVQRLRRVAIGSLRLGELPPDSYRPLTRDEVTALREAAENIAPTPSKGPTRKRFTPAKSRAKSSSKPAAFRKPAPKPPATDEFQFGAAKAEGAVIGDDARSKSKDARGGGPKKKQTHAESGRRSTTIRSKTRRAAGKPDPKGAGGRGKSGGARGRGGRK
ncbi:MAG: pseudouridine synthase [Pirellulales bacterium]